MRAAGGWGAPSRFGAAAGQLQCLVRQRLLRSGRGLAEQPEIRQALRLAAGRTTDACLDSPIDLGGEYEIPAATLEPVSVDAIRMIDAEGIGRRALPHSFEFEVGEAVVACGGIFACLGYDAVGDDLGLPEISCGEHGRRRLALGLCGR